MKRLLSFALLPLLPVLAHAGSYSFNAGSSLNSLSHGTAYTWGLNDTYGWNLTYGNLLSDVQNSSNVVTGAQLTIYNIYDWTTESKDVLYVNLLNNVATGVQSYTYNSNPPTNDTVYGTDPFVTSSPNYTAVQNNLTFDPAATGSLLVYPGSPAGTWSDPHGDSAHATTLVINFSQANLDLLNQYLSADSSRYSPNVGLGFGPDCHYYDQGVCLTITTGPGTSHSVPDGGNTVLLLGTSLLMVAGVQRLRSRAKSAA